MCMGGGPKIPATPPVEVPAVAPTPNEPSDTIEVGGARKREEQATGRYGGVNLRIPRMTDATLGGMGGSGPSTPATGLNV